MQVGIMVQHKLTSTEINLLIQKVEIESYLKRNNIEYKETGDSSNPQFSIYKCPFCNNINYKGNEHPNRLYIGKNNSKFHCFNCGSEGLFLKFIAKFEQLSFREIFDKYIGEGIFEFLPKELSESLGIPKENKREPQEIDSIDMPEEFEDLFSRPQGKFKDVYQYMINRGMTLDRRKVYRMLDIRYCEYMRYKTPSGKICILNKRLIFPIYWENKLRGFIARDIVGDSKIKYYISEKLPKSRIIYNYENIKNSETIIICEGVIDAIKCFDYKPIALFGTSLSNEQLILLQNLPNLKNIIIGLDPDTRKIDKYGKSKYNKLVEQLKPFWNIYEIDLGEKKDLGECTFEEVNKILGNKSKIQQEGLGIIL